MQFMYHQSSRMQLTEKTDLLANQELPLDIHCAQNCHLCCAVDSFLMIMILVGSISARQRTVVCLTPEGRGPYRQSA